MLNEDFKVICKVMCSLNRMLFVDSKMFYSSTILLQFDFMMMQFIFIFLLSYFSMIFLVKGKISKSMFLSHFGPKRFWQIRLQDFKSNICLFDLYELFDLFHEIYL